MQQTKTDITRRGYGLSIFGGMLIALSSVFEAAYLLHTMGFSILQKVELTTETKIFLSLCIFLGFSAATLAFISAYLQWKGHIRIAGVSSILSSALALLNVVVPFVYGFEAYQIFALGVLLGVCLIGIGFELASYTPRVEWRGPILTSREVAVTAVLSAAYAVLIIVVKVPSPTGGYTHIGDLVVFIAALLFGCKVGGLVGIVGSVAADFYVGYERWFVSILAHGLEGAIPGLTRGKPFLLQALSCVIGGFLMATTYFFINVFIKGYPLALISYIRDLFVQAGVSIVVSLIIVKTVRKVIPQFG